MNDSVLKYIENEKEISQYNIHMLERREITPARKRLVEIEREFLSLPLEKMSFQTVEQVAKAIDLYRQSRSLFYLQYNVRNTEESAVKVSKKISFLDKISSDLMTKRVQEVNPVQDSDIYQELVEYYAKKNKVSILHATKRLDSQGLQELQACEPAIIAKKRARLQTCLYSLGEYIADFVDRELDFQDELALDLNLTNSKIDSFVFNLEECAFKFYNSSLEVLPSKFGKTMGENSYLEKIYNLDNVFSLYSGIHTPARVYTIGKKIEVDLSTPKLGNLYLGYKDAIYSSYQKDADRETKNRVFGVLFPIERTSREKMTPLYTEIFAFGINITELFSSSISNIRVINESGKKIYYKGILMKPLWELLNYASQNPKYHYVLSKILNEELNDIEKFNNKEFVRYINSKATPFINVDLSSKILIPKTRSEEQYLDEVIPLLNKRIFNIKNDYKNII